MTAATDSTGLPSTEVSPPEPRRRWRIWIIGSVCVLIVGFQLLRMFVLGSWVAVGSSMSPTFDNGDRVIVNRLASAQLNDIVVVRSEVNGGSQHYLKRIVAVGGDTLVYEGCVLTVNGDVRAELYLDLSAPGCGGTQPSLIVPDGHVYVLGDNRAASLDSRSVGSYPKNDIVGVVVFEL